MSQYTAPNLSITSPNGTSYAYRHFGKAGTIPLVFLQHFRGNLDNWDPALVDDIAAEREVILVDNSGVGLSTGATPHTVEGLARDILAFVDALGLTKIDLFGFSTGGFVAQEVILLRPRLVRRLILGGTGPQGGRGFHNWREETGDHAYKMSGRRGWTLSFLLCDRDEPGPGQGVPRTDLHPRTGPRRDASTGRARRPSGSDQ